MEKIHRYTDFNVGVDSDELPRYLGYRRDKRPDGELAGLLTETSKEAESLAEPAAIFSTFDLSSVPKDTFLSTLFRSAEAESKGAQTVSAQGVDTATPARVVLAVCTIGPKLEERVSKYSGSGELARALVLDAAGSSLAEAVCDFTNQKICEMSSRQSLYAAPRISPGYGRWRVEEQEIIFKLLPADSIEVTLTKSYMMVPRKSVSFAVSLTKNRQSDEAASQCTRCRRKDCEFRR